MRELIRQHGWELFWMACCFVLATIILVSGALWSCGR
jgi:hypothetical protein